MVLGANGVYIYIYMHVYTDPGSFFPEKTMSFRNDSFIPGKIYIYMILYAYRVFLYCWLHHRFELSQSPDAAVLLGIGLAR